MTRRTALLLLFAMSLSVAFAFRGAHAQGSETNQGVQRFMQYCAACHGADAKGGDKAPSLFLAPSPLERSDDELFGIVRDGTKDGMPPFAQIGDANIRAIVQFLRMLGGSPTLKTATAKATVTGDADLGRTLYFGKAQCSECHLMQGKGGFIAGSLTNYGGNRGADEVLKAITRPDIPLLPSSQVVAVTTSAGRELSGVLRNEDNFSLELQTEDGRYHFFARSDLKDVRYTGHSLMPRDYATRLSPKELNDLVSFLIVAGRNPRRQ